MEIIEEKDKRFKKLEWKIGLMVVVALAGIALVIVYIGIQKDLFISKYSVYFIADSGTGFKEAMPVRLSGFKIGRVKTIELIEGAQVKVTVELNRKYDKWMKLGAWATLAKEGFIGESYVEVALGHGEERPLEDGERMPYMKARGMEEIVEEVKPVLREVKDIIHYVNDPEGEIKKTLVNVKNLTADMSKTRQKVDDLLDSSNIAIKRIDTVLKNTDARTGELITNVNSKITSLTEKAEGAVAKLPAIAEKVDGIAENVRKLTGGLANDGPRIREIIANAEDASIQSKTLIRGVREGWPGRLMTPEPKKPELVPLDGTMLKRPVK